MICKWNKKKTFEKVYHAFVWNKNKTDEFTQVNVTVLGFRNLRARKRRRHRRRRWRSIEEKKKKKKKKQKFRVSFRCHVLSSKHEAIDSWAWEWLTNVGIDKVKDSSAFRVIIFLQFSGICQTICVQIIVVYNRCIPEEVSKASPPQRIRLVYSFEWMFSSLYVGYFINFKYFSIYRFVRKIYKNYYSLLTHAKRVFTFVILQICPENVFPFSDKHLD